MAVPLPKLAEANEKGAVLWEQLSYRMQASWALPKLLWLLRNQPRVAGCRLMHQNDWINAKLAGIAVASDSSHSLKTGYDLLRSAWPVEIFDALGIPAALFPQVVSPGTDIGEVSQVAAAETGLPAGTRIYAGMTDGCAAQIASGAMCVGDWNSVIGTTLVLKGVTRKLLNDPSRVIYSHRSPEGTWLPGGASSSGAGAIAAEFSIERLAALNECAAKGGPSHIVVYPLTGRGERFPFVAPNAESFTLGSASSEEERYRAVLQGIALLERLCFDHAEWERRSDGWPRHYLRRSCSQRGAESDTCRCPRASAHRSGGDGKRLRNGGTSGGRRVFHAGSCSQHGEAETSHRASPSVL